VHVVTADGTPIEGHPPVNPSEGVVWPAWMRRTAQSWRSLTGRWAGEDEEGSGRSDAAARPGGSKREQS